MEFGFTAAQEAWRREILDFLRAELPADWYTRAEDPAQADNDRAYQRAFRKRLAARGWLAVAWPVEYGGQGRSAIDQAIFNEEMAYHRAPATGGPSVNYIGPSIMLFGDEGQKRQHLGAITSGEVWWCQGFSEPNSGSDLASLQTRAVEDGDDWVVNGTKIWTTYGHVADWCYLAARTNPDAPKHRGISVLLVDMKTPGIRIRPLPQMSGVHGFNQVYFDEVRVPRENLLGERDRGWYQMATTLDFERSGIAGSAECRRVIADLVAFTRANRRDGRLLADDPVVRDRLAEMAVRAEVGRLLAYKVASMQTAGLIPNREASAAKVYQSELRQQVAAVGMALLGPYAALKSHPRWAAVAARVTHLSLDSVGGTIGAGASEIQRNIIATRGLGLPR
jgi:alkylation response protein AidB-like acyl-CoA dehydrogenase